MLTHGLAKKSEEHRKVTVFYTVHTQGRKVIPVQHGVILIPRGHELETWDGSDIRFQRWDSTQSIQLLLQAKDNMDAEGASESWNPNEAWADMESPRATSAEDQGEGARNQGGELQGSKRRKQEKVKHK